MGQKSGSAAGHGGPPMAQVRVGGAEVQSPATVFRAHIHGSTRPTAGLRHWDTGERDEAPVPHS